jgi:hypothetical protein
MDQYRVEIREVHLVNLVVMADSKEEAIGKATDLLVGEESVYSHTEPVENWIVEVEN